MAYIYIWEGWVRAGIALAFVLALGALFVEIGKVIAKNKQKQSANPNIRLSITGIDSHAGLSGNISEEKLLSLPFEKHGGITTGLIIQGEYVEKILAGTKTWEMRSRNTSKREVVGLIKKGTGEIYGVAKIVGSLELSPAEIKSNTDKHGKPVELLNDDVLAKYNYAWVLDDVVKLPTPIRYVHKAGAVVFVNLDIVCRKKLNDALSNIR